MLRYACTGILVVKYNRGVGGANNRMLWLSDDFTTLRWADESRLAKSNRKLNKSGTPTREREATNLALKSVVDVEYGYGRCVALVCSCAESISADDVASAENDHRMISEMLLRFSRSMAFPPIRGCASLSEL
jgi:hypothetical protein